MLVMACFSVYCCIITIFVHMYSKYNTKGMHMVYYCMCGHAFLYMHALAYKGCCGFIPYCREVYVVQCVVHYSLYNIHFILYLVFQFLQVMLFLRMADFLENEHKYVHTCTCTFYMYAIHVDTHMYSCCTIVHYTMFL